MLNSRPGRDSVKDEDPDARVAERMKALGQSEHSGVTAGIRITGEIKGDEDLIIGGEVNGSVFLPGNQVRVKTGGRVQANITARIIEIEGRVAGDLKAGERIVIRASSVVDGDIVSPQIQLEEGCEFKGSVQMQEPDLGQEPPVKKAVDEHTEVAQGAASSSAGEE